MDFKIGEDFEYEENNTKKKMSNGMKMTIVIIVSLVAGITVFLISNYFFGKKTEVPNTSELISLTDSHVQQAYSYVTYGALGERYAKFVQEQSVDVNSFTNAEKFNYAFMSSSKEDFIKTGSTNTAGANIYSISNDKVNEYMKKFFGDNIIYSNAGTIELVLDYTIEDSNMATLTYDQVSDSFFAVFKGVKEKSTDLVQPYIGSLTKAIKRSDDNLELQERVIYTDLVKNTEDNYTLNIYKDYNKNFLLESKSNLTEEKIKENPISVSSYLQSATLITYKFNKGTDGNYYFVSSSLTN